jgi:hypothetical protein
MDQSVACGSESEGIVLFVCIRTMGVCRSVAALRRGLDIVVVVNFMLLVVVGNGRAGLRGAVGWGCHGCVGVAELESNRTVLALTGWIRKRLIRAGVRVERVKRVRGNLG